MSGIMKSARIVMVKATCGHEVMASIPPGELSTVGRRHIAEANSKPCFECRTAGDRTQDELQGKDN